jgi:hypothetical protein
MKQLKHPATIIATLALFIGLAGGAYAGDLINGSKIKNHSISSKKLNKAAVKQFTAQKPDGTIINYNAVPASASPSFTPLGTILGDTLGAACAISSGNVTLEVGILTSDGSWSVDYDYVTSDNSGTPGIFDNSLMIPAGSITSMIDADSVTADSGGSVAQHQVTFVQTAPMAGSMTWHEWASTATSNACHLTIQYAPEAMTAVAGASHPTAAKRIALRPNFLAHH